MSNSHPEGYFALPASGKGDPVMVLHAWWGLNDTIKTLCNRLAEAGYVAFAPDLYHGEIAVTIEEAEKLGSALSQRSQQASDEAAKAAAFLRKYAGGSIGVIGFSLGASYAVDLSTSEPDLIQSVVLFYGAGEGDYSKSKASYLGHFAENDAYEPQEYIDALESGLKNAGRPVTFYTYEGTGHWFFEPDRTDAYNEAAADLAWSRTLDFLKTSFTE